MQILQSSKCFTVPADMNDKGLLTSVLWSVILNKYLIVFWRGSDASGIAAPHFLLCRTLAF